MDTSRSDVRRNAFIKLAALSSTRRRSRESDIDKLSATLKKAKVQENGFLDGVVHEFPTSPDPPMSIRNFEVLLALCKAAPTVNSGPQAERLVTTLSTVLPDIPSQTFTPSSTQHQSPSAPWQLLTYELSDALLYMGQKIVDLRVSVLQSMNAFVQSCIQFIKALPSLRFQELFNGKSGDTDEAIETARLVVSLVGFLEAVAQHVDLWKSVERLELIRQVRDILSDRFLVAVERASSIIRSSESNSNSFNDWKRYLKHYGARGQPVGAMLLQQGFMRLVVASLSRMLAVPTTLPRASLLDHFMSGLGASSALGQEIDKTIIKYLTDILKVQIQVLEDGSDYFQPESAWQQGLAFSVKAFALEAFLHCMMIDRNIADAEVLFSWLDESLMNEVQMADNRLANVVFKSVAVVARYQPETASELARKLLKHIVSSTAQGSIVAIAAQSLSHVLRLLSQDAIMTTMYSLGNVLSSNSASEMAVQPSSLAPNGRLSHHDSFTNNQQRSASVISISVSGDDGTSLICENCARAIGMIAMSSDDSRVITLAQSMLIQKIGRVNILVDCRIIEEAAILAITGKETELRALLRFYSTSSQERSLAQNHFFSEAVLKARVHLAHNIRRGTSLYRPYLVDLLEGIISKGDVPEGKAKEPSDIESTAQEIVPLLKPLAILLSSDESFEESSRAQEGDEELFALFRDAWFNIAAHDITLRSKIGQQYHEELRMIAVRSCPLVDKNRAELLEGDVELNSILKRGMSAQRTAEQKQNLIALTPQRESEIRRLPFAKVMFVHAVHLIETLRAVSGDCSKVLHYFVDSTLKSSDMGSCLAAVADDVVRAYLSKTIQGQYEDFSSPYISRQLAKVLIGCCHRSAMVRHIATTTADRIVSQTPSALCQKAGLFALLELLTIMWTSCLEADIDEYEWTSTFTSSRGKITVELSDDYAVRRHALNIFHGQARKWVARVIAVAPLDVKGLLQTYLSEYDDTGAYGHVALGRSFAVEMGSLIPPNDQRLQAVDHHDDHSGINVASDFIAQYTTRQEYRYIGIPEVDREWLNLKRSGSWEPQSPAAVSAPNEAEEAQSILAELEGSIGSGHYLSIAESRDVLSRAASLLCRSKRAQCAIVHHLVAIPFEIFTKASIKLGISLWLGVIHENARMEPRILVEVVQAWEKTITRKVGIFGEDLHFTDPFYIKEEFAPSDKAELLRQQQAVQNAISPHFRVLQFFESHFNAVRLGSIHTQRVFIRMIDKTLKGFRGTKGHPLTREIHFHAILFALKILKLSTTLTKGSHWRLRDEILSAALSWFKHFPMWSFGGNRLQIKAEVQVMGDILTALRNVQNITFTGNTKSLVAKQNLLQLLLENERMRLTVWLFPLDHNRKYDKAADTTVAPLMPIAWNEHPSLALHLVTRFPSETLRRDLRRLILNFTDKVIDEPDGLESLLGPSLPKDVSHQLKYLLYWAPVNPMQAVTYFLPAYGNHPFILQYAMRALESHSVDVTFFYVPQIVQALRYDALGYVERYIIETGKFSQLFAHQIIWNMKANAYKDEDSEVPDSVKPVLDKVMDSLISSFGGEDKDFYEREFTFFNEVTDISGKLRPFIKRPKPEKKQKIEEELRKIKVDVGVYLPSNPDGVVVGIDRKSGKPLQSHAKAPYMATFRIRKSHPSPPDGSEVMFKATEQQPRHQRSASTSTGKEIILKSPDAKQASYEVWQSAIFKVGDDCRQDVLALQMIAAFRGIFNSCGLDVYVYPYRVTATAPGCGVIDVLPNSISRDMLGREAVNGLYDYFVAKYGGEDSIRFQEARANFVKSMAAYSVISYLLQFKDRHNGNIMVDDAGHILHIDFGFCFDIAPGGVRFERAPFKLTSEMMAVMGGSNPDSQSYRWFEELTIKAFLASRQYADQLCYLVSLMLDSGLPCFKPETIVNFRKRFVLERGEREAADLMRALIKKSEGSLSTKGYDQFQLLTNGIPY